MIARRSSALDSTAAVQRHVADGAEAHESSRTTSSPSSAARGSRLIGHEHAVAAEHGAAVREVDGGELDRSVLDVLPDVELGPVRQREHPDVLARACGDRCRGSTARAAGSSGPTGRTRRGTRRSAPWRGPSPRRAGRRRTPRRTRAARSRRAASWSADGCATRPARVLDHAAGCRSTPAPTRRRARMPSSLDRAGRGSRAPRGSCGRCRRASPGTGAAPARTPSPRGASITDAVLAAREQQHRPLELGRDLAEDVDRLGFERVEVRQRRCPAWARFGRHEGRVGVSASRGGRTRSFPLPGPAAGARVVAVGDGTGARPAADRRVALRYASGCSGRSRSCM